MTTLSLSEGTLDVVLVAPAVLKVAVLALSARARQAFEAWCSACRPPTHHERFA